MQHQPVVRMRYSGEHVEKQAHTGLDVGGSRVAPAIDWLAFDVLDDEVRLAARGDAGVEQGGDVRVRQAAEQQRLASEPGSPAVRQHLRVRQLDGGDAIEAAVVSSRQPDAAHPAGAEHSLQRVRADQTAHRRIVRRVQRAAFQKALVPDGCGVGEQGRERFGELGVGPAQIFQAGCSRRRIELQQLVEQRTQAGPSLGIERAHSASREDR